MSTETRKLSTKDGVVFVCRVLSAFGVRNATAALIHSASKDDSDIINTMNDLVVDIFGLYATSFTRKILRYKSASPDLIDAISAHFNQQVDSSSAASLLTLALRILATAGPDFVSGYIRLRDSPLARVEISAHEASQGYLNKIRHSPVTGYSCMQLVRKYLYLSNQISDLRKEFECVGRKRSSSSSPEEALLIEAECAAEVFFWQWAAEWLKARNFQQEKVAISSFPKFLKKPHAEFRDLSKMLETILSKLERQYVVRAACGSLFSS